MKKTKRHLKKIMALALTTTMLTPSVLLANPIAAYEDTHRLLLEELEQRRSDREAEHRALVEEFAQRIFGPIDLPDGILGAAQERRFERTLSVNIAIPTEATTANVPITTGFDIIMVDSSRLEEIDVIGYNIVGRTGSWRGHEIVIMVANAPAFAEGLGAVNHISTEGWIVGLPDDVRINSTARVARGANNLVSITIPVSVEGITAVSSISVPITIPANSIFAPQEGASNLRDEHGNLNIPYGREVTVTIDEKATGTAIVYAIESGGARETTQINFSARIDVATDVSFSGGSLECMFRCIVSNIISHIQWVGTAYLGCCLEPWFRLTDSNGNPVNLNNKSIVIPAPLTHIIEYMIDNNEPAARAATRAAIIAIDEGRFIPVRDNFRSQLSDLVGALGGNSQDPLNDTNDFNTHQSAHGWSFTNALVALIFNLNMVMDNDWNCCSLREATMDFALQGNSTATNWEMRVPAWTMSDNHSSQNMEAVIGSGEIRRIGITTEVSTGLEADFNWNEPTSLSFNGQTITLTLDGPTFTEVSPALFSAISTGSNVASWFTVDDGRTLESLFGGDNFTATVAQGSNSHMFEITLGGTFDLDALHDFFGLSRSTDTF